ncbi:MAG: ABC transporter [Clostridiales bacterium 38-18]|nr:MAG: ABC transporter [Clostridiales bacterium 38-18]
MKRGGVLSIERSWVGAKWWKFDFHAHSPASDDYGKGDNQSTHKQIAAQEWVLNYMRAGIDCVAITDHNSGAWIDQVKTALCNLREQAHPEYRPLFIFPGIELTVNGNIHLLGIFSVTKSTSDIDTLIGNVRYRGTKGLSDACTERTFTEVVDDIVGMEGIAIPAHVDEVRGLFVETEGVTLNQCLSNRSIIAMELKKQDFAMPQTYVDNKLNWTAILGTDSHHPVGEGDQSYPGSSFTWIKMTTPSIEGLRLALLDGELSVKRCDETTENMNKHSSLVIQSIEVEKAKYYGQASTFSCEFNPWLNCIIGGRGTGKSTLIEFVRNGLNRDNELPTLLKSDFKKYREISNGRNDEGLLKLESVIRVNLIKNDTHYRATWNPNTGVRTIEECDDVEGFKVVEGDVAQRFPVSIYSQKQIFEMAKNPQTLLDIIDNSQIVKYSEWEITWNALTSSYLSLKAQMRTLNIGLAEEGTIKGMRDDIARSLAVFEKAEHSEILKEYQLCMNQNTAIDNFEIAYTEQEERIKETLEALCFPELDSRQFSAEREEDNELLILYASMAQEFSDTKNLLIEKAKQIVDIKKKWVDQKNALKIKSKIEAAKLAYMGLTQQLLEAGVDDPEAYDHLVMHKQEVEQKLINIEEQKRTLTLIKDQANDCLEQIKAHRVKLTERRTSFLEAVLQNNQYVRIKVNGFSDKTEVEKSFRDAICRSDGRLERDIGTVENNDGLISSICNDQIVNVAEAISKLKETIGNIHALGQSTQYSARDRRFIEHIQSLSPEVMDKFEYWYPEDAVIVEYRLNDGVTYKSIEHGSPGQKTAALLAFIMSYGDEPLILDQPEDDLDNHLIFNLIVSHLRSIKCKRQIIVVTHNANIVVNGDSENVISLDVVRGQSRIDAQGSLQEVKIRENICTILEGGKIAFEKRYKRINA